MYQGIIKLWVSLIYSKESLEFRHYFLSGDLISELYEVVGFKIMHLMGYKLLPYCMGYQYKLYAFFRAEGPDYLFKELAELLLIEEVFHELFSFTLIQARWGLFQQRIDGRMLKVASGLDLVERWFFRDVMLVFCEVFFVILKWLLKGSDMLS